jgi:hypothetical protein
MAPNGESLSSPLSSPGSTIYTPKSSYDKIVTTASEQYKELSLMDRLKEEKKTNPDATMTNINVEAMALDNEAEAEESITARQSSDDDLPRTRKRKSMVPQPWNPTPQKQPRRGAAVVKRTAKEKKWEAPFVYTDDRSPLAKADLRVSYMAILYIYTSTYNTAQ